MNPLLVPWIFGAGISAALSSADPNTTSPVVAVCLTVMAVWHLRQATLNDFTLFYDLSFAAAFTIGGIAANALWLLADGALHPAADHGRALVVHGVAFFALWWFVANPSRARPSPPSS